MKFFLLSLSTILFSLSLSASQPLVPLSTPHYFRLAVEPVMSTDFNGLNRAEVAIDFAHRVGGGFEWGTTLQAGAASNQLFISNDTIGILGLDFMGRYFGAISEVFYMGLQLDVNYTQNLSPLGKNGAVGVRLSMPIGSKFDKSVAVYIAPGIRGEGAIVDTTLATASVFAQSLGASLEFGMLFYTYGPGIFLSARPTWPDVRALSLVSSDFALGLVFDL